LYLAKVVGRIVSTAKHHSYENKILYLVRPVDPQGEPVSASMVAVDTVGAGEGDMVLVASEGRSAAEILAFDKRMPLRSIIVGIVDKINRGE
jgi:ethanolamine utilization protein EutN